jgi:hypothetical protein
MANNVQVTQGSGTYIKTTETGGVHVAHHNIDTLPPIPAGANVIGKVGIQVEGADVANANPVPISDGNGSLTVDGTVSLTGAVPAGANNIGDVDVLSVIPGVDPQSLGKAEDNPHVSGDTGVMALGVRRDADTSLAGTDGDYAPPLLDALGRLKTRSNIGTQTSGAYSDNDFIDGKLTLSNVVPVAGGSGEVVGVRVYSKSPQTAAYDVVFFNADPSASTFTDNGAGTIADADLTKIFGVAHCTDATGLTDGSVHQAVGVKLPFKLPSGTTAYACVIARDAVTQTSTSDLILAVDVRPD